LVPRRPYSKGGIGLQRANIGACGCLGHGRGGKPPRRPCRAAACSRSDAQPALRPETIRALIGPSIGPSPKRAANAAATRSVTEASDPGERASISARIGVPWQ